MNKGYYVQGGEIKFSKIINGCYNKTSEWAYYELENGDKVGISFIYSKVENIPVNTVEYSTVSNITTDTEGRVYQHGKMIDGAKIVDSIYKKGDIVKICFSSSIYRTILLSNCIKLNGLLYFQFSGINDSQLFCEEKNIMTKENKGDPMNSYINEPMSASLLKDKLSLTI